MSYMTSVEEEESLLKVVKDAAENFEGNPKHASFGDLTPGSYLALRWGLGEDCILILKLDHYFENRNYQQAIKRIGGNKA